MSEFYSNPQHISHDKSISDRLVWESPMGANPCYGTSETISYYSICQKPVSLTLTPSRFVPGASMLTGTLNAGASGSCATPSVSWRSNDEDPPPPFL